MKNKGKPTASTDKSDGKGRGTKSAIPYKKKSVKRKTPQQGSILLENGLTSHLLSYHAREDVEKISSLFFYREKTQNGSRAYVRALGCLARPLPFFSFLWTPLCLMPAVPGFRAPSSCILRGNWRQQAIAVKPAPMEPRRSGLCSSHQKRWGESFLAF